MSINTIFLSGHAGKDPEIRSISADVKVANFTLAVAERGYTKRDGTAVPERTEWFNVVAFRHLAEQAEKHVRKGSRVFVKGSVHTRSYDKDGVTRYVTEVFADEIIAEAPQPKQPQQSTTAMTDSFFNPAVDLPY